MTGVILTKLDGTAKGGVVIGIRSEFDLPVKLIGTGEAIDNLEYFDAKAFGEALFAAGDSLQENVEAAMETEKEELAEEIIDEIQEGWQDSQEDGQEWAADVQEELAEIVEEAEEIVEEKPRKRGFFGWGGRK